MNKYALMLEEKIAMRSPTLDAEYAIDERSLLAKYDCLIPQLKEHRKFRITKDSEFSLDDFKAQLRIKTLQAQLEQKQLPKALEENKKLK